jgi:hypothetical protein
VVGDGARWVVGAGGVAGAEAAAFTDRLRATAALAHQSGLIDDLDRAADILYRREPAAPAG